MTEAAAAAAGPENTSAMRLRIIEAAVDLTVTAGWSAVTMARLAEDVGVSRQTIYNEIGSKPALAEAMVLDELARFLTAVREAFERNPDDLVAAIRAAAQAVLERAHDNILLRAIVSATHGADTELLPLLTTHSESLLAAAKVMLTDRLTAYDVPFDSRELDVVIDVVVRVVLSHVMQPSDTPERTAEHIAWVASRVLRP